MLAQPLSPETFSPLKQKKLLYSSNIAHIQQHFKHSLLHITHEVNDSTESTLHIIHFLNICLESLKAISIVPWIVTWE